MTAVLLWKECRDQWSIWLALAVVAAAALIGVPAVFAPEGLDQHGDLQGILRLAAGVLAWTYGLVCGGMLLAGEREGGTMAFLDTLPALRIQLWGRKCLVGLLLLVAQVVVLAAVVLWARLFALGWGLTVLGLLASGLIGFAWAMLFAARGHNVLNVIGLAFLAQIVGALIVGAVCFVIAVIVQIIVGADEAVKAAMIVFAVVVLTGAPLAGSAWLYSETDRLRRRAAPPQRRPTDSWHGYRNLLWLSFMQARWLGLGLIVFAMLVGFLMPLSGLAVWSLFTLGIGVLCGVAAFRDEQEHGSFRFVGDQRLPLGRVWVVKVGVFFALALVAAFVVLLPSLLTALGKNIDRAGHHTPFFAAVFRSALVGTLAPSGCVLVLWLAHGFAAGHLCGLLFRKTLVGFVAGLGVAVLFASVWLPSLFGGGLCAWQVLGVPVFLLVTARLLMHPWAADRLVSLRTVLRLATALAVCLLWVAGNLWYRVAEVPSVPARHDVQAFVASLPTVEKNENGRLTRGALASLAAEQNDNRPTRPLFAGGPFNPNTTFPDQLDEILVRGWPGGRPELSGWLDAVCKGRWREDLAAAARKPLGPIEDYRNMSLSSFKIQHLGQIRLMPTVLAVDGLRQQAAGKPERFIENLDLGLSLSRTLRYKGPWLPALLGISAESRLLRGLDRWLEKLDGRPDLLRKALVVLQRHLAELPPDDADQMMAEYVLARNSLDMVERRMMQQLREMAGRDHASDPDEAQVEETLVSLAWQVHWEQKRHARILWALLDGDESLARTMRDRGDPVWELLRFLPGKGARNSLRRAACRAKASLLAVALRLYQAESGKPAAVLTDLVPRYLPAVPEDPFDGKPFRYRVSQGEFIAWTEDVAQPGQQVGGGPAGPIPPPGVGMPPGRPGRPGGPGMPPGAPGMPPGGLPAGRGMPPGGAPPGPGAPPGVALPPPPAARLPGGQPAMPGMRRIPAGQGILWSVGEDGRDDGGRRQAHGAAQRGEDRIFLVPLPPVKKPLKRMGR